MRIIVVREMETQYLYLGQKQNFYNFKGIPCDFKKIMISAKYVMYSAI